MAGDEPKSCDCLLHPWTICNGVVIVVVERDVGPQVNKTSQHEARTRLIIKIEVSHHVELNCPLQAKMGNIVCGKCM